jgi:iron-sulfur cluster assembly protein
MKGMEQVAPEVGSVAAPIQLTDRAVHELQELMSSQGKHGSALRVWVAGQGCAGLNYGMALDDAPPEAEDNVLMQDGVKVYIDGLSLSYMQGSVVDYVDDMMGGGFRIENPLAQSTCGCGSSFSTEEGQGGGGCGSCGCR